MSKRNFILLIIILVIAVVAVFGFLFLHQPAVPTISNSSGNTNFFSQFNPFGNSNSKTPTVTPPVNVSGYVPPPVTPAPIQKLIKVSSMPIAGYIEFSKERLIPVPVTTPTTISTPAGVGTSTVNAGATPANTAPATKKTAPVKVPTPATEFAPALRYVSRANGNIYETFVDNIAEQQFSNTVFPQVYDAYFGSSGLSVVMRHLKPDNQTIETFVGTLPKEVFGAVLDGTNEIKGSFLPDDVKDISLSPDTSKIFYLFNNQDSIVGTTLTFLTNKKVQIFDSPFTEWLSQWPTSNIITLSTKPSATVPGYMYSIDGAGKNLTAVLGNINGLTTLTSPSGKLILYSGNDSQNNLTLSIYNISTKASTALGVKTLPEKCVWNKTSDTIYCAVPRAINPGLYPDTWYQGEVSFSDQIWKIDVKTGNATMLLDPTTVTGGEDIDGTKLALDTNENYLFFVNKKDSFLWEFNLK